MKKEILEKAIELSKAIDNIETIERKLKDALDKEGKDLFPQIYKFAFIAVDKIYRDQISFPDEIQEDLLSVVLKWKEKYKEELDNL